MNLKRKVYYFCFEDLCSGSEKSKGFLDKVKHILVCEFEKESKEINITFALMTYVVDQKKVRDFLTK